MKQKYEFSIRMVNSELIINQFAIEIFDVYSPFKEHLTGKFENVQLSIEYEPLQKVNCD